MPLKLITVPSPLTLTPPGKGEAAEVPFWEFIEGLLEQTHWTTSRSAARAADTIARAFKTAAADEIVSVAESDWETLMTCLDSPQYGQHHGFLWSGWQVRALLPFMDAIVQAADG